MEPNAFAPEFLDHFAAHDEPATSFEASTSGPWRVIALGPEYWGVIQDGDAAPHAAFKDRELALLAAAMLPASGRDIRLVLSDVAQSHGFPVSTLGQGPRVDIVAWLATFSPETLLCLHNGLHLALSPASLAFLLEAAGPTALRRAGAILAERLQTQLVQDKAAQAQDKEPPVEE